MTRTTSLALVLSLTATLVVASPGVVDAAPGDAIAPTAIRVDATYESIGVVWEVTGDTNLNSSMLLEFRPMGTSTWQQGAPAVRSYPSLVVNGEALGLNRWGASAMFLEPDTTYEIRLTLSDPDGGGAMQTTSAATRDWAEPSISGRQLFVVPGSGGGGGSSSDPFRGLQAAADAAQPGDTIMVEAGSYSPFQVMVSGTADNPISFSAQGSVVVDGGNTDRGVVTIGNYDRDTAHIILDGFVIRSGRWGIDAQNTQDILIVGNTIQDVDYGILNRRGNGTEARQTICDNEVTGRTSWPQEGVIPGERGIDLRGTGNVVCHNTIRYFGDCVSVQPFTGDSFGNDVYGNDAAFCVDDGIEIDYNQANARVWRNRVTNARMGVSVQPVAGGPAYIVRNEFFNLESVPIKMHNDTTGFYVAHNTGVKVGDGHGDNGAMWRNATFRNNVFIGTRYAFEFTTVADEGYRDLDYNAWGTTRQEGPGPWFKWDNTRYDRMADLPDGVEEHGVEVGMLDLVGAGLPSDWDIAVEPGSADLRLASGSAAIHAGATLPNLNDGETIVGNPDMGAFEYGFALPEYGPRLEGVGSRFIDVPAGTLFFTEIEWIADQAITKGCNPPLNDRYCPNANVTRGQMAAFLARALNLPPQGTDTFTDDNGTVFEANIEAIAAAEITKGCNPPANDRYCPNANVTRGQMAAFLARALNLPPQGTDTFTDDNGTVFEANIEAIAAAEITKGCNPPANDRYCPNANVTRGQMAAFLYRALSP